MRKIVLPLLLAIAASTLMPAQAVTIGRAASVSVSRPASVSTARPATPAPRRIGGGQSVGMTRPDVMQAARTPTPPAPSTIPTTVAPAQRQYAPAPAYQTPAAPVATGPSAGTMFAATAGGALVGTMAGNAITQPHTTVVAGGGAPVGAQQGGAMAPGDVYSAPAYVAPVPASSGGGWAGFWSFLQLCLILAALAALIWFAVAVYRNRKNSLDVLFLKRPSMDTSNLPFSPVERFVTIQRLFAQGDASNLERHLGRDLHQLLDKLPDYNPDRSSTIGSVSYEVLDRGDDIISIRYRFTDYGDSSDSEPVAIQEVWHFIRFVSSGEYWLLNGIEQFDF